MTRHAAAVVPPHLASADLTHSRTYAVWHVCTEAIRDRVGGPISATKILAFWLAAAASYSIYAQRGSIQLNALWLFLAAGAMAFGKSTFNFLLSKVAYTSTRTETATDVHEDRREDKREQKLTRTETLTIAEQTTRHIDKTIGRGPAGEPLRSKPPVAGATTPAGDA